MIHTVVYGFIAKDDDSLIHHSVVGQVTKVILLGVKHYPFLESSQDNIVWVKCLFWKNHRSKLYPYLTKGKQVIVTGNLTWYPYLAKNQEPKVNVHLHVENLSFVTAKPCNRDPTDPSLSQNPTPTQPVHNPNIQDSFQSIYGTPEPKVPDLFSHAMMAETGDNDLPF